MAFLDNLLAKIRTVTVSDNNPNRKDTSKNQAGNNTTKKTCCSSGSVDSEDLHGLPKIVLLGTPNVGKSALFNRMTGVYVTVSNYPGTTVEVSRGRGTFGGQECQVIDTPGMYSFLPITEEEMVTRRLLLDEHPELVLHVADAKNIPRMLPLTLQLIEAGLPAILVVNIMDEAERSGIRIDIAKLKQKLGIPVVATAAARGRGIEELNEIITQALHRYGLKQKVS